MRIDAPREDPFRDVLPFVLVAECRSFRRAAQLLGLSPSATSRALARLEERLETRLLVRTSRSVSLTSEGELFLERCQDALEVMEAAAHLLTDKQNHVRGFMRVSLPLGLGRAVILPSLPRFAADYPDVQMQVVLTDRYVDLVQENVEVAVRVGSLDDTSLVATRVGNSVFVTVASPDYLKAFGAPQNPEDLGDQHRCLVFTLPSGKPREWVFMGKGGVVRPHLDAYFSMDDGPGLVELCLAGFGIAHVPNYLVDRFLKDGRLVRVLPGPPVDAGPVHCLRSGRRHMSARSRAFVEHVRRSLAE